MGGGGGGVQERLGFGGSFRGWYDVSLWLWGFMAYGCGVSGLGLGSVSGLKLWGSWL